MKNANHWKPNGKSEVFLDLLSKLERIAPTTHPVLLGGETGTGKTLLARYVHDVSGVKGAFVTVNCAAIPESLVDSHLFGHVKGSFTGAEKSASGMIRAADGGTLFLDEIGEMSPIVQPKLLHTLEQGLVTPVGSSKAEEVSIRLICATHRPLTEMVKSGDFREDLFYRISTFEYRVPALRERPEDISVFVERYLSDERNLLGLGSVRASDEFIAHLRRLEWPGNIRELFAGLAYAMTNVGEDRVLKVEHLPERYLSRGTSTEPPPTTVKTEEPLKEELHARLFQEIATNRPKSVELWAEFFVHFSSYLGDNRFTRKDILPLVKKYKSGSRSDAAVKSEWMRNLKAAPIDAGILEEAGRALEIKLDKCREVIGRGESQVSEPDGATIPTPKRLRGAEGTDGVRQSIDASSEVVGRVDEVTKIVSGMRAAEGGVFSLVGPGGVGKTTLARLAANRFSSETDCTAHVIELENTTGKTEFLLKVCSDLGVPPPSERDVLTDYVANVLRYMKGDLVVIDNFEQLQELALDDLLKIGATAPDTYILVTTRTTLPDEAVHEFIVPPLALPSKDDLSYANYLNVFKSDATKLFLNKAEAVGAVLDREIETAQLLMQLYDMIGGLPLSLILAASQLRRFTLEQLVSHIRSSMDVLSSTSSSIPARQRSMHATFTWSFQLLSEDERAALLALSTISGKAPYEVCRKVIGTVSKGASALQLLERLRQASLADEFPTVRGAYFSVPHQMREVAYARRDAFSSRMDLPEIAKILVSESAAMLPKMPVHPQPSQQQLQLKRVAMLDAYTLTASAQRCLLDSLEDRQDHARMLEELHQLRSLYRAAELPAMELGYFADWAHLRGRLAGFLASNPDFIKRDLEGLVNFLISTLVPRWQSESEPAEVPGKELHKLFAEEIPLGDLSEDTKLRCSLFLGEHDESIDKVDVVQLYEESRLSVRDAMWLLASPLLRYLNAGVNQPTALRYINLLIELSDRDHLCSAGAWARSLKVGHASFWEEYTSADEDEKVALQLYRSIGSVDGLAMGLAAAVNGHLESSYAKSLPRELLEELEQLAMKSSSPHVKQLYHGVAGRLAFCNEDYREALYHSRKSVEFMGDIPPKSRASINVYLGDHSFELGDWSQTIACTQEAEEVLPSVEGDDAINQMKTRIRRLRVDAALMAYKQSLSDTDLEFALGICNVKSAEFKKRIIHLGAFWSSLLTELLILVDDSADAPEEMLQAMASFEFPKKARWIARFRFYRMKCHLSYLLARKGDLVGAAEVIEQCRSFAAENYIPDKPKGTTGKEAHRFLELAKALIAGQNG